MCSGDKAVCVGVGMCSGDKAVCVTRLCVWGWVCVAVKLCACLLAFLGAEVTWLFSTLRFMRPTLRVGMVLLS